MDCYKTAITCNRAAQQRSSSAGRASPRGGVVGGRADLRRRQLNAGAAPVFIDRERKPGARCGPAFKLTLEETVPPHAAGRTITIIPRARPRTNEAGRRRLRPQQARIIRAAINTSRCLLMATSVSQQRVKKRAVRWRFAV